MIQQLFFPYHCILCLSASDQSRDLCTVCQQHLPMSSHTCAQCGLTLPEKTQQCGSCMRIPPVFDDTTVGFHYLPPVDGWLKKFKFHHKTLYARILSEIFAEQLQKKMQNYPEKRPQALLPVPLHWRRLCGRGFNQAHTIATHLSRQLRLPIVPARHVYRIKATQAQSTLSQKQRAGNIKNAFALKNCLPFAHIALVDDIMTTGNTANALATLLKQHGVHFVSVWAIARAHPIK